MEECKLLERELQAFLSMKNAPDLCRLTGTGFQEIQHHLLHPEYLEFSIPKKRGKARSIQAPAPQLMLLQKKINRLLQWQYEKVAPSCSTGFRKQISSERKSCSIVQNAAMHVGKKMVLNVDIKDFFSSITFKKIEGIFLAPPFGLCDHLAMTLAHLCTFKGILPTGAPTSPVLSNFLMLSADRALMMLAIEHGLAYSRYADDLTFSSDAPIAEDFLSEVQGVLTADQFILHPGKIRWCGSERKQKVTGIKVNHKLNIEREYYRKLRAMIDSLGKKGPAVAASHHFKKTVVTPYEVTLFMKRLTGMLGFMREVRGQTDRLYIELNSKLLYAIGEQPRNGLPDFDSNFETGGIPFFRH